MGGAVGVEVQVQGVVRLCGVRKDGVGDAPVR